jgi:dihydrofolate reductase
MNRRKVSVFIAMSLDGYIAGKGGDMSFVSCVEVPNEDYGYNAFIEEVDTVIMGRSTFDWVFAQTGRLPHHNKQTIVVTHRPLPEIPNLDAFSGDLAMFVNKLRNLSGRTIYVDGGASVVDELMQKHLIDEVIISIIPVVLGGGTRLFDELNTTIPLDLKHSRAYSSGLVQLTYVPRNQ